MQRHGLRSLLAILMAMLLTLLSFAACDAGDGEGTEEEETTSGESVLLTIPTADLSQYRIIYPQDADETVLAQVAALQLAFSDVFGLELEIRDDFAKAGTVLAESEYEILVGRCDRAQSAAFCAGLRTDDYGYTISDKKILIAGGSSEATALAAEAFMQDVIQTADPAAELFLSTEAALLVKSDYEVSNVYLNGTELGYYTVVYPSSNNELRWAADYLVSCASEFYDYSLTAIPDSKTAYGREILLGETNRDTSSAGVVSLAEYEYLTAEVGESIWLTGDSSTAVYRAISALLNEFSEDPETNTLSLDVEGAVKTTCETSSIRSMTFNIRTGEFTSERIALVCQMIDTYAPDTVGFQEASASWMSKLKAHLSDRYAYVGVGRNADGSGETTAIFYLKSKFELVDGGTKWMCETPDVPGSKVPESSLPRIFSWVVLRVIGTEQTVVHVNTHLEHTSEEARVLQAGYLVEFLEQYRKSGAAYIVTGDYNCERGAGSYGVMTSAGLSDSLYVAKESEPGTTYHGYGTTDKVIDHIFVSSAVDVLFYRACVETFRYSDGSVAYPSDHNPVVVDYVIW